VQILTFTRLNLVQRVSQPAAPGKTKGGPLVSLVPRHNPAHQENFRHTAEQTMTHSRKNSCMFVRAGPLRETVWGLVTRSSCEYRSGIVSIGDAGFARPGQQLSWREPHPMGFWGVQNGTLTYANLRLAKSCCDSCCTTCSVTADRIIQRKLLCRTLWQSTGHFLSQPKSTEFDRFTQRRLPSNWKQARYLWHFRVGNLAPEPDPGHW
jgi:hypothetical protein